MSGFGYTNLVAWSMFPDKREHIDVPHMNEMQIRKFAKLALQDVPGGKEAFNHAFGGSYIRNGVGMGYTPYIGIPWNLPPLR